MSLLTTRLPGIFLIAAAFASSAGAQSQSTTRVSGSFQSSSDSRTPSVVYVDLSATGANNGSSWANAFNDLQDGLAVASGGNQIWVAEGEYVPTDPGGLESDSFVIPPGVSLYGGFAGDETSLGQRDPEAHPSTLSGDIDRDDTSNAIVGRNSWHIVEVLGPGAPRRLDGFQVVRGSAFYALSYAWGAGIRIDDADVKVTGVRFFLCWADAGGAAAVSLGSASFENCDFESNTAVAWGASGGAVFASDSNLSIADCSFTQNRCQLQGGGSPHGGAIYLGGSSASVERSSFVSNDATTFNQGTGTGGAINVSGNSSLVAIGSVFVSNTSNVGGAIRSSPFGAPLTLINCVFDRNECFGNVLTGGSAGSVSSSNLTMIGCTVSRSFADDIGGVVAGGQQGLVTGSIFWGNRDNKGSIGISQISANYDVEYSCVENMLVGEAGEDPPDAADFPGSIDADPLFVDAATGDYRLLPGSPCIDAADNGPWFPFGITADLDGNPRFVDDPATVDTGVGPAPIADMGAYEFQAR